MNMSFEVATNIVADIQKMFIKGSAGYSALEIALDCMQEVHREHYAEVLADD